MATRGTITRVRRAATGLVLTGAALLLGAGAALAASVDMVDDDFTPGQATIAAGESITFTNRGDRPHTATADGGSFDTGTVQPGASATVTFDTPGTYRYYCQFHGGPGGDGMSGIIEVTGGGGGGGGNAGGGQAGGGQAGGGQGGGNAGQGAFGDTPSLPQTATPLPLIAAGGAILLVTGLLLGRRRATR